MTTCHSPVSYSILSIQLSAVSDILYFYSQEHIFFFFKLNIHPILWKILIISYLHSNGIAQLQTNALPHQTHI